MLSVRRDFLDRELERFARDPDGGMIDPFLRKPFDIKGATQAYHGQRILQGFESNKKITDFSVIFSYLPSYARFNFSMSILVISIIAAVTRSAFSGSGSFISSPSVRGIICHETPN